MNAKPSELKLNTFLHQRCCSECGEIMNTTRSERNNLICPDHQKTSRHLDDLTAERILLEHFKNQLIELGIQGFMVHTKGEEDGIRGEFLKVINSPDFNHPAKALVLIAPLIAQIRKLGKDQNQFFEVVECNTPVVENAIRLVNPSKPAPYITIIQACLELYKEGYYHEDYIIEPILNEEDNNYVICAVINQKVGVQELTKKEQEECNNKLKSYTRKTPTR